MTPLCLLSFHYDIFWNFLSEFQSFIIPKLLSPVRRSNISCPHLLVSFISIFSICFSLHFFSRPPFLIRTSTGRVKSQSASSSLRNWNFYPIRPILKRKFVLFATHSLIYETEWIISINCNYSCLLLLDASNWRFVPSNYCNSQSWRHCVLEADVNFKTNGINNWRANIQSGLTHKSGVKTGRVA